MKAYLTDSHIKLDIPLIRTDNLSSIDKYDCIIVDNNIDNLKKSELIRLLSLTTSVKKFINNEKVVYIISSIDSFKSTINKKDGIQYSEDIISYKDLDVEKTCRVAYELAKSSLLILDSSNKLISSRLFRKIATDINQDYQSIYRQDALIDDLNYYLDKSYEFILTEALHENLVVNSLLYKGFILDEHYLTNDIARNIYISYNNKMLERLI